MNTHLLPIVPREPGQRNYFYLAFIFWFPELFDCLYQLQYHWNDSPICAVASLQLASLALITIPLYHYSHAEVEDPDRAVSGLFTAFLGVVSVCTSITLTVLVSKA